MNHYWATGVRPAAVHRIDGSGRDEKTRKALSWENANTPIGPPAETRPEARIPRSGRDATPGNASRTEHPV